MSEGEARTPTYAAANMLDDSPLPHYINNRRVDAMTRTPAQYNAPQ